MKKLAPFKYALVASFVTHSLAFAMPPKLTPGDLADAPGLNQPVLGAVLAVPAPVEVADAPADQGNAHGNVIPVVALDVAPAAQNQGHQDALAHASDDEEDAEAPHAAAHESSDEEDDVSDDEEGAPVKRMNSESENEPAKRVKLAAPADQGGQAHQTLVVATTGAAPALQAPVVTPAAPQPTASLFAQAAAAFNPRNVARGFVAGLTILTGKNPRK